jgi:phage terminase large subunit
MIYPPNSSKLFEYNYNPETFYRDIELREQRKAEDAGEVWVRKDAAPRVPTNIIINQGGMGSGKSYAIMQAIFTHCCNSKITATVAGKHLAVMKNDVVKIGLNLAAAPLYKPHVKSHNKQTGAFEFHNGSKIVFKGLADPSKARGMKQDICYISEANLVSFEAYNEIQSRTERMCYIDYNPTARFWAHDLRGKDGVLFIRSNYLHNPYLYERDELGRFVLDGYGRKIGNGFVRNILSRKDNTEWYKVYGLGYTGQMDGLVYKNVRQAGQFPLNASDVSIGVDFGYSRGFTAIMLTGWVGDELYVKQLDYGLNRSISEIAEVLKNAHNSGLFDNKDYVIVADPGSGGQLVIRELHQVHQIDYLYPAKKAAGSVEAGIQFLQAVKTINVCEGSKYLWAEFMDYAYADDPKAPNKPLKQNDHAMDALRYAVERLHTNTEFREKLSNGKLGR